ncbi:unnamed protein product [Mucor fragilis]
MPPNSGVRQRNNPNDIKTLRAQYRQALPSLTELFPDWSHNDLLFVMDECQGDLDLAITRISEGHANQWGQVKSKKPKPKPAQLNHKKSNQKSSSSNTTAPTSPSTANPSADGKARGNNGKSKGNGKHHKSKRNGSRKDKAEKQVVEEEEEKKPSWASIAKGPTKPEVVVQPNKDVPCEAPPVSTAQEVEVDNKAVDQLVDQIQEQVVEQVLDQITEEAIEQAVDQPETDEPRPAVAVIEEEPNKEPVVIAEPVIASNTAPIRKPTIRRLNQTEPVVLPNNQQAVLPSVNVQFGSLNLANGEEMARDENEEAVEETAITVNIAKQAPQETKLDVAPSPSPAPAIAQAPEQAKSKETLIVAAAPAATPTTSTVASNGLASFHNTNKPLPEPFHPQQQQPIQPQQQQPIQPQPMQPHLYAEPYSMNPYATYVANMHNSVAGYTGGIPADYYSADPQRMTYYDTSFYGQSPLMNGSANGHLFTRDRYNTPPPHPPHPPMEMMNQTPPPPPPSAQQYPHPHSHPAHHPHAPPPPPPAPAPQAQNYGYYPLSYQQQQQQQQTQPQQPYVNKSMYNAAIPINKYDYSAYEDYYQQQQQQQQQQQNHEMMYTGNHQSAPSAPPAHPPFQQLYQPQQQPQPSQQPYWH